MSYVPPWAKGYKIIRSSANPYNLTIEFWEGYTTQNIKPIEQLAHDLAVSDVLQQMRDKPLSERIDNINPPHYKSGDVECIDAIKAALTAEEYRGYLKGNVIKYMWRNGLKGCKIQDAKKAEWYLKRFIDYVSDVGIP